MDTARKYSDLPPSRRALAVKTKKQQLRDQRIRIVEDKTFRMRGVYISDTEWNRLTKSIKKLRSESKTGVEKQIVMNNLFKEFNDRILGEGGQNDN